MTVQPLDPDSPAGVAAAEAISQALAEIQVAIWRRTATGPAETTERPAREPAA